MSAKVASWATHKLHLAQIFGRISWFLGNARSVGPLELEIGLRWIESHRSSWGPARGNLNLTNSESDRVRSISAPCIPSTELKISVCVDWCLNRRCPRYKNYFSSVSLGGRKVYPMGIHDSNTNRHRMKFSSQHKKSSSKSQTITPID